VILKNRVNKYSRFVFLVDTPLYQRDYHRYGAQILLENGFDVLFLNFSPFMNPQLDSKGPTKNRYQGDRQKVIFSKREALDEIQALTRGTYLICLPHYRSATFWLYKAISDADLPYCLCLVNLVPTSLIDRPRNFRYLSDLSRFFVYRLSLRRLPTIIKNFIFQTKFSSYLGIRPPDLLLASGKRTMVHPQASLSGGNTEILWMHSMDYDRYLECIEGCDSVTTNQNQAVFLDTVSPLGGHDVFIPGLKNPLSVERYFPSVCAFLDRLERALDLTVAVAANPHTDHVALPDYLGGRRAVPESTCEMVKNSKLVITRGGTATLYAVMFNKPVIFYTTGEMENSYSAPLVSRLNHSLASWFGKVPINIDKSIDVDWETEMKINDAAYARIKENFIKMENTRNTYIWQAFADGLK
jgi:hypothetical protein